MRLAKLTVAGVLGLSLVAPMAWAEAPVKDGEWFVTGGYGGYRFENRDINDNKGGIVVGVGRRFGDWGAELTAGRIHDADSETSTPQRAISIDQQRIEVLRFINVQDDSWLPYVAAGLGRLQLDAKPRAGEDDESFIDLGVGLMRNINRRLSIRGDLRGLYGSDSEELETAWSVGLMFALGGGSSPAPAIPAAEPAAAPMAAAAAAESPKDTDGDGVLDEQDACPGTEKGAVVDEKGCYKEVTESVTIDLLLEFDYDKSNIRDEHKPEIQRVVDFMTKFPAAKAELVGHTDSRGSDAYNQTLSERRANAVRDYMMNSAGIGADRVTAEGRGESEPKLANDSEENMQRNRRVAATFNGSQTMRVKAE